MPDLQLRYHVHSEQEPKVKEQQQDERREYDPLPDAGCERVMPASQRPPHPADAAGSAV